MGDKPKEGGEKKERDGKKMKTESQRTKGGLKVAKSSGIKKLNCAKDTAPLNLQQHKGRVTKIQKF